jgi:2-methylcitrate dehydratase PrpD
MSAAVATSGLEAVITCAWHREPSRTTREAARLRVADVACAVLLGVDLADWPGAARTFGRLLDGSGPGALWRAGAVAACCRHTEIDDIHLASCTTPGAVAVPTALACTQAGADPEEALDSVIAAYEVCVGAGELLGGAYAAAAGTWPTRAVAPIAAAAGVARAFGLDVDGAMEACAIAAGAVVSGVMPEPARAVSLGLAVAAGVAAGVEAAEGMSGDRRLLAQWPVVAPAPPLTAPPGHDGGGRITETLLKPYAAARQVLAGSAGLRRLVDDGAVDPATVRRVELSVPPVHAAMVDRPDVRLRLDTLASAQYQLAAALARPAELDRLDHARPPDPELARRMAAVAVRGAEGLDAGFPARWGARLSLDLATGSVVEELAGVPGEAQFDWASLGQKSERLAGANHADPSELASAVRAARRGELAELGRQLWDAVRGPRGGGR